MNLLISILLVVLAVLFACWVLTRLLARNAETTVPPTGKFQSVSGGEIHYTDAGPRDGVPLVLIHGLSGNMHNFAYGLVQQLSSEYRVITIDRPGSGYSTRADDDLAALPSQARMISDLLDRIRVENPVLVGHSLGGAIALAMAVGGQTKIAALALLCPLTQFISEPPAAFKPLLVRSSLLRRLIGHTIAVPIASLTLNTVLEQVFSPESPPGDFMVKGGGILGFRPQSFIGASADLHGATISMAAITARYATDLKTPGGVLFGADDRILSPELHGRTMESYGLFYETLPARGHMIPVTAPQDCVDFIRRVARMSTTEQHMP